MNPQVLVVSRDPMLLQTRQLILGAFFQVRGAGRVGEAQALISKYRFNLIVLCYTLSEAECQRVFERAADQRPCPKILIVNAPGSEPLLPVPDYALITEAGPYLLLKKSAEILGVDLKVKAKVDPVAV
jgi:hypothetical protein